MLEVDVEGREVIDAQAVYLCDVILVARHGARRRCTGESDILDIAERKGQRMLFWPIS